MHTQLGSGGRIEAVHLKQQPIVMRLIALLLVSVFSLAAPSVSRASFRVVHVFVALADNQHQGIIPVPPALGNGQILSAICIGAQLTALRRTSRPARIGNLSGQAAARKMQFWSDAF